MLAKRLILVVAVAVVLLVVLGGGVGMFELTLWLVALIVGLVWAVRSARRHGASIVDRGDVA